MNQLHMDAIKQRQRDWYDRIVTHTLGNVVRMWALLQIDRSLGFNTTFLRHQLDNELTILHEAYACEMGVN